MFKQNVALTAFPIGCFIGIADGIEVIVGAPTGTFICDGTPGALAGSASYDATALHWVWSAVQAAAMNGAMIGLTFKLAGCIPIHYVIRTDTSIVSDVALLVAAQAIRDALMLDASAGAPAAGSVDAHLDAIKADTAEIGVAGAGLTAIPTVAAVTSVATVTGNVNGNVGGNVTGSVGSVVGLTPGNLDAAVSTVKADTAAILLDTGTDGVVVNVHTIAGKAELQAEATDALNAYEPPTKAEMDAGHALLSTFAPATDTVETGITWAEWAKVLGAVLAGVASGGGTTTVVFRALDNSGTARVTATVDANGNRSVVALNL